MKRFEATGSAIDGKHLYTCIAILNPEFYGTFKRRKCAKGTSSGTYTLSMNFKIGPGVGTQGMCYT